MKKNKFIYTERISFKKIKETLIKYLLSICGYATLVLIILIFFFLLKEGIRVFTHINPIDFLFTEVDKATIFEWLPTSQNPKYSLLPLLWGSFITAFLATLISLVLGIALGIYLAEFASNTMKEILKPIIELFAGIPTVVLGFFVLIILSPVFNNIFEPTNRLNAFAASLGLSLIVIPIIATLTEETIHSLPHQIRNASLALGASRWQTLRYIILPAALNGISAATILSFGRAIGETMIVLMVSGNAGNLSINIFQGIRTMAATIASEMGEVAYNSSHYYALFFIGFILFTITFLLNFTADLILTKLKKKLQADEK